MRDTTDTVRKRIVRGLGVLLALLACVGASPRRLSPHLASMLSAPQDATKKPYNEAAIEYAISELRKSNLPQKYLIELVQQRKVEFKLTPELRRRFIRAGAGTALLNAIEKNYAAPAASPSPLPPPKEDDKGEIAFWESINKNEVEELRLYLAKYSNGIYSELAKTKIKNLQEENAWQAARESKNADVIRKYIAQYPQGKYVAEANRLLDSLKPVEPPPKVTTLPLLPAPNIEQAFVSIAGGVFQMGATRGERNERPMHRVQLTQSFYLGKYEVTQAQWEAIMGYNPSYFRGDAERPVENVSWEEIQEFLRRLNARDSAYLYRLPTEAEWEYAAQGRQGNEASVNVLQVAWDKQTAGGSTHKVGQKQPNGWGLFDLYGNVSEWCADWYEENAYSPSPVSDPTGPITGKQRVFRGSGWYSEAFESRSSARHYVAPTHKSNGLGFRLVALRKATPGPPAPGLIPEISTSTLMSLTLNKVSPPYPSAAKNAKVTGVVEVQILLAESGEILEATVVRGPAQLREAALQAAKKWRFRHYLVNGTPTKARGMLVFNFTLQ
ncbi:MAG: TonB family protein [Acidobacteria bacterium]|nr:TonB family protein [Acidobacteriota bacterium]